MVEVSRSDLEIITWSSEPSRVEWLVLQRRSLLNAPATTEVYKEWEGEGGDAAVPNKWEKPYNTTALLKTKPKKRYYPSSLKAETNKNTAMEATALTSVIKQKDDLYVYVYRGLRNVLHSVTFQYKYRKFTYSVRSLT